jgi:hypothetical protein
MGEIQVEFNDLESWQREEDEVCDAARMAPAEIDRRQGRDAAT